MKTLVRVAAVISVGVGLLGVANIEARKGGTPAPPPPVLCGCACPDGSFVITHAPDAESCPSVCENACNNTM